MPATRTKTASKPAKHPAKRPASAPTIKVSYDPTAPTADCISVILRPESAPVVSLTMSPKEAGRLSALLTLAVGASGE